MSAKPKPLPLRLLAGLAKWAAVLVAAALFLLAVAVGTPRPEEAASDPDQPLLTASPPLMAATADDLPELIHRFPVPVLAAMDESWQLVSCTSADTAFEGGLARVMTLVYRLSTGAEVTAVSVYPRRAEALLPRAGWHLCAVQPPTLSGLRAVAMTRGGRVRVHARSQEGLYWAETDGADASSAAAFLSPLKLYVN